MNLNIEHECGIRWLEDPARFPYLREFNVTCTAKRGWRVKWADGNHVVAVAELNDDARTVQRRLYRRAWHFDPERDPYPGKDKPSEAVIPSSIVAGKKSTYGRTP